MNILELNGVTKSFDTFKLDNVGFNLPGGSIMGFIGENGAGKSTTIKLILNLLYLESGSISVFGKDNVKDEISIKEDIGVVFDENNFPAYMTTRDVDRVLRNIYRRWDSAAFNRYTDRFSLPDKKTVKDFSRGMKMKLAIAAALSHNAKLLLLDEATSGLDPIVRNEILDIFLEFIQDDEHSILVSSHIVGDLEKVADYITFIHGGRIVFSQPTYELHNEYGILKCSTDEMASLDAAAIKGYRKNAFGVEALARRNAIPAAMELEPATIEDIMLYTIKGAH